MSIMIIKETHNAVYIYVDQYLILVADQRNVACSWKHLVGLIWNTGEGVFHNQRHNSTISAKQKSINTLLYNKLTAAAKALYNSSCPVQHNNYTVSTIFSLI